MLKVWSKSLEWILTHIDEHLSTLMIIFHEMKNLDHTLYRSMIRSLLYLTARKPDLCYSMGICERYQANPKESHLTVVKKIIKF